MSRLRRLPRTVVAATVATGCLVLLWSVAAPAYRIVDEPQWLSTALRLADGDGYPPPGSARVEHAVVASYPYAGYPGSDVRTFVPQRKVGPRPAGWPSWATLADAPADPEQLTRADQMTQHPPAWALLAAGEITLFRLHDAAADTALLVLRLLQGLLLLPLPALAWLTARRVGASERAAGAVAWFPVLLPQLLHVGVGVGDTALLELELFAAAPLLVAVATGDLRRRLALLVGAVLGVTLLTKAFGVVILPAVPIAYAVGARGRWRGAVMRAVESVGLAVVVGGWWYLLAVVHNGSPQPNGYPPAVYARFAMHLSAGQAVRRFGSLLLRTSWADLGWLETPAPIWFVGVLALALLAALVLGVVAAPRRLVALATLAPLGLLLLAVTYAGVSSYRQLSAVYGVQGRYLFPALAGVAAVVALAFDRLPRWLSSLLPAGALVAHGMALLLAVQHFWAPSGGSLGALHTVLTVSVVPAALVAVAAVVGAAACGVGVWQPRKPADTDVAVA